MTDNSERSIPPTSNERFAPNATFECLSDVKVDGVETAPLLHKWPGWWSKMELFRPDVTGDFVKLSAAHLPRRTVAIQDGRCATVT